MGPFDSLNAHVATTLKITDFDSAQKHVGTDTMSVSGTWTYMAPEVILKQWFSKASDVWSYGVVMWEMLTMELPHNGQTIVPLLDKASTGQLTLSIPESIPKVFEELLLGCWRHDAKSRLPFKEIIVRLKSIHENNTTSEDRNICFHDTAVRRELPCKHILCMDCVENMIETAGRSDHLSCPNCEGLFTIAVVPKDHVDPPQYVREKYRQDIKPSQDAGVIQHNAKIMGMTVKGDELFVVCKSPPNVFFKYNIGANNKAPWKPVQLSISDMKWPRGIAASENLSCLYITDWHTMFGGQLWRYKYRKGRETKQEDPVAILDVQPFGVSVSQKTEEVLVTCATPANIFVQKGWIYIYKPSGSDFLKIRTIDLPGVEIPRHSILTPSSKFIVCHGWNTKSHGVTSYLYDESGLIIKKSFYGEGAGGGNGEQEMNRPLSMIQDEDGLILVVDYYNHRIQLLTEDLQLVRHLITSGIIYPRQICQHPKTGRIYVSQEDGKVGIFDSRIAKE